MTYAMWAGGSALMALGDQARALLTTALRDPLVVARYRAKMVQVPGSDCLWWRGAGRAGPVRDRAPVRVRPGLRSCGVERGPGVGPPV